MDAERLAIILARRAEGCTLQQIGEELSLTRQRIQQILAKSEIRVCPYCKRPNPPVPGRRRCEECYAAMMAARPSKKAKAQGYRTSSRLHRRSAYVRLARMGLSISEIAQSMRVHYMTAVKMLAKLRAEGKVSRLKDARRRNA